MPWQQTEGNEEIKLTDSEKRNYVDTSKHVEMSKQKSTRSINEKQNLH